MYGEYCHPKTIAKTNAVASPPAKMLIRANVLTLGLNNCDILITMWLNLDDKFTDVCALLQYPPDVFEGNLKEHIWAGFARWSANFGPLLMYPLDMDYKQILPIAIPFV